MQQQDDHCWIVASGESWAIRRIEGKVLLLWRGYWPDLDYSALDVSKVDWESYCAKAAALLQET